MDKATAEKMVLKPCPFCGEADGEFLAFGPTGHTKEIRDIMQATHCLTCGAQGPLIKRTDEMFTAARESWNNRTFGEGS